MIARVLAVAAALSLVGCTAAVQSPASGFGPARDSAPSGTFTDAPRSTPLPTPPPTRTEPPATPHTTPNESHARVGEYLYVEELPEPIERVAPEYPEEAKRAGIEGKVILQCFVGVNGAVGEVRVQNSIPALDAAAIAAVKQWRFKPALSYGKPVAVWVAVPVNFPPN